MNIRIQSLESYSKNLEDIIRIICYGVSILYLLQKFSYKIGVLIYLGMHKWKQ